MLTVEDLKFLKKSQGDRLVLTPSCAVNNFYYMLEGLYSPFRVLNPNTKKQSRQMVTV